MSRKSIRRAALGLLVAVLLGIALPAPASAWTGAGTAGFLAAVWEWVQDLWPGAGHGADPNGSPDPVQPACTEDCGDAGYGVDPNG